ncbi:hypothetical protein BGZ51_005593 [Haplosporangium sp. Z 767]|nr:hypothetical protein BGZ51_005593 [Haplosporangium sp. Z 767]KAF9182615.1 hypothetical protein BGZ50_004807 [Haplosporangium sp. Z 11]
MLSSDNPPRNKILVVGRRGVGKLSLVHSILGSRIVPTTSVSKSRPSSPLILPAIPVPTLQETVLAASQRQQQLQQQQQQQQQQQLLRGHGVRGALSSFSTLTPPINTSTPKLAAMLSFEEDELSTIFTQLSSSQESSYQHSSQDYTMSTQGFGGGGMAGMDSPEPSGLTVPSRGQGHQSQQQSQQSQATISDHSGITIPWTIDTKYYSVDVDFWIDETEPQGRAELDRMIESGELDEMGAVIEAVIFCFSKNQPSTFHDIKPWINFVDRHEPSITLCVATNAPITQQSQDMNEGGEESVCDYDDWCLGNGFEFIDLQDRPTDITQDEHVGLDRILEALAAHMWDGLKRKSNKKREEHERSMMMSFRDDDMDMSEDHHRHGLGLDLGPETGSLGGFNESMLGSEDGDEDDDDRAFYKAIAELNLQNRPTSPSVNNSGSHNNGATSSGRAHTHGFDDDFDLDEQEIKALEGDDLKFWSSQEPGPAAERHHRYSRQHSDGNSNHEAATAANSGAIVNSLSNNEDPEFSFELGNDHEFEFGDYVVASGQGGDDEELDEFGVGGGGISTPNHESIRAMHAALFSNIDGDDGMAQTIATLQGLREQGKNMSERERRELAARVALSFGMQMGE